MGFWKVFGMRDTNQNTLLLQAMLLPLPRTEQRYPAGREAVGNHRQTWSKVRTLQILRPACARHRPQGSGKENQIQELYAGAADQGLAKESRFAATVVRELPSHPQLRNCLERAESSLIEEKYCEIAAKRLSQEVFQFTEGRELSI